MIDTATIEGYAPIDLAPSAKGLLIVDLSAVFWWKWHASAGESIDAAYEYTIGKVYSLASRGYDECIVALDVGPSFRAELYPNYKANRPPRDKAAIDQILRVRKELKRRGFALAFADGFEADDVIATLVERSEANQITIAGSDKDLYQLISDRVTMLGLQSDTLIDAEGIKLKLGVRPDQVCDYLALVGDSADNVKGVPGVGPIRAKALLERYETLDAALADIDNVQPELVRRALVQSAHVLSLSRQLVTLRTDAPIEHSLLRPALASRAEAREPPPPAGDVDVNGDVSPVSLPATVALSGGGELEGVNRYAQQGINAMTINAGPRFGAAAVTRVHDASPHKFILTGRSGVGKTYFLSTIPDVFILPVEEGLKGASPDHDPARFRSVPRSLAELYEALDAFEKLNSPMIEGKRPYRYLSIDSLAGIETLVHKHLQTEARVSSMEGKDYQKMWREIEPRFIAIQERLDLLRRRQGVHIWLTAHSSEVLDAVSTTGEIYRKWDLLIRAPGQIGSELRNLWRGWADHVLFIDWAVAVKQKSKTSRTIGKIQGRVMYTSESGTHYAKTRSRLPPSLPATWADLAAALKRGVPAGDTVMRGELDRLLAQLGEADRETLGDVSASGNALAALVSRARGLLSVARESEETDEATVAPLDDEEIKS